MSHLHFIYFPSIFPITSLHSFPISRRSARGFFSQQDRNISSWQGIVTLEWGGRHVFELTRKRWEGYSPKKGAPQAINLTPPKRVKADQIRPVATTADRSVTHPLDSVVSSTINWNEKFWLPFMNFELTLICISVTLVRRHVVCLAYHLLCNREKHK